VALLFLDTSALAKLYIKETGTERMLELVQPHENQLAILSLARVELRAAIRRRMRLGDLSEAFADAVIADFANHLRTVFEIQPVSEDVFEACSSLLDKHSLRAYDALQLAGFTVLRGNASNSTNAQFVSADRQLLQAAMAEGFSTVDPLL
jgi:predicted nucleic acid-binding protein